VATAIFEFVAAAWTSLLSNEAITQMVGHEAFARAMVAARGGHVHDVELDEQNLMVSGRVKGTYRDDYAVRVYLASSRTGTVTAYRSQCTCPVVVDCKHAAAVLIVARHLAVTPAVERPAWEKTLDKLIVGPAPAEVEIAPLACEFGVEQVPAFRGYAGRRDLRIRPVRRGKGGSWIRSGISWDDLDFVARSYVAEHRELLLQLRAAAGSSARYTLPRSAWLSLSTVGSGFWGLLDQAAAAGLTLITAAPLSGPLRTESLARVQLDASRSDDGTLLLRPQVRVEDQTLSSEALGVIGEPAHGIFWLQPGPNGTEEICLARLEALLNRELRHLLVEERAVAIPGADEPRFWAEFAPSLRAHVPLAATDGSVLMPAAVPPTLALTVSFQPDHRIHLDWAARYAGEGGPSSFSLAEPAASRSVRDPTAEQALLAELGLSAGALPTGLAGRDALQFVEHRVPELTAHGVDVLLSGAVVDYRQTTAEPQIRVTATPQTRATDWFDLQVTVTVDGEEVPFDELFVALARGEEYLVLDTGVYFDLDRPEFTALRELISESQALVDRPQPELSINRFQTSLWEDLAALGAEIDQSVQWNAAVRGLAGTSAIEPVEAPAGLSAHLRPYQLDGLRWLHFLWSHRLGGILADDMGLGKTLQTLALIVQAREIEPEAPPFLVVAPTSVVSNWTAEADRFAPGLRTVSLAESTGKRGQAVAEVVAGADLVITSYALLRIECEALAGLSWSGLVLDEAQFVKNHRAKTHTCARRIPAPFKLAITGTPLENSLMDLWALLSITAPGLFPSADRFAEYYRRPIERQRDAARLTQLRRRIRPVMLRRTKDVVATELPPKQEQVVEVELHPRHQRLYQTHLQRERQKVLGLIDDLDHNRFTVLRSLTLLRRLSLDAALLDEANAGVPAAKVEVLLDDLAEIVREGHQALVFSQFTTFLGRIRTRLEEAGVAYAYLDGQTRDREKVVARFRTGEASVFLISLKAGGFGLNLSEAGYCFVLDPWWNPATEAQAVDRAHRIGQTKSLMVYRLVAKGTIEEKVMALKTAKQELFGSIFDDEALSGAALTADEIRDLMAG
jgi:superfamily II DNA or RNA helicase